VRFRAHFPTIGVVAICIGALLLVAGCGGGGSSAGSNSTAPPAGQQKKATAPNAPAGSKVVACEGSPSAVEGLRVTAVDCATAERVARRWEKHRSCALAGEASRGSCTLGSFRCQTVKAERGALVSCARPGGDIAFVASARSSR
jgi:hypothetical protein